MRARLRMPLLSGRLRDLLERAREGRLGPFANRGPIQLEYSEKDRGKICPSWPSKGADKRGEDAVPPAAGEAGNRKPDA